MASELCVREREVDDDDHRRSPSLVRATSKRRARQYHDRKSLIPIAAHDAGSSLTGLRLNASLIPRLAMLTPIIIVNPPVECHIIFMGLSPSRPSHRQSLLSSDARATTKRAFLRCAGGGICAPKVGGARVECRCCCRSAQAVHECGAWRLSKAGSSASEGVGANVDKMECYCMSSSALFSWKSGTSWNHSVSLSHLNALKSTPYGLGSRQYSMPSGTSRSATSSRFRPRK